MHSESAAEEVNGKIVNGDGTIEWKLLFHWNGSWNSEARDVYIPFLLPPKYERQKKDIGSWRMKDVEKNWTVFETCSQCEPYSMWHNTRNAESELMQHPKSIRKPVQLSFHGVFFLVFCTIFPMIRFRFDLLDDYKNVIRATYFRISFSIYSVHIDAFYYFVRISLQCYP